jgi:Skp family chaperone for outer membrane proteins
MVRVRELRAEHDALVARIRELNETVETERVAQASQVAWIRELNETIEAERVAHANQIAKMQATFDAERQAFVARIREADTQIRELDARIRELLRRDVLRIPRRINQLARAALRKLSWSSDDRRSPQ